MAAQRLYAVFYTSTDGRPLWALHRNGRTARRLARLFRGQLASMPLPSARAWDAPTFRVCADRYEDFR